MPTVILALLGAILSPVVQDAGGATSQANWLLRSADANADGDVSRAEWDEFVAGLTREGEELARGVVLARGLSSMLDGDGDGVVRFDDLTRIHGALDANGDGVIEPAERPRRGSALNARDRFLAQLVLAAADEDQDGTVTAAEWTAFLGEPEAGATVPWERLAEWVRLAARATDGDRNALGMSVVLVGYDADLDLNQDGRVDAADLEGHFASFDADQSSVVERRELDRTNVAFNPDAWQISAEKRASRPLMPWQRNLDDALAMVERTGKPLLLCVNMDGESASDKLALDRYRDDAFLALASGFIPLIASPDRRNPRDFDDRGRRIQDPRFGRVTNSEAIDIEPELFKRYFGDQRVAPRHVGVAPDGSILFDLYLLQDLSRIDRKLEEFGVASDIPAAESLSVEGLLDSPDAGHRDALEAAFLEADEALRVRLAGLAFSAERSTQHPALARLALNDPAPAVRVSAAASLARAPESAPLDLFPVALGAAHSDAVARSALLGALKRKGEMLEDATERSRAERLLLVFTGLSNTRTQLQPARWELAYGLAPAHAPEPDPATADFEATAELVEKALGAARAAPTDIALAVHATAAQLRFARVQLATGGNPLFAFEDVLATARRALEIDPENAHALGYLAVGQYMLGRLDEAAPAAQRAIPPLAEDANSQLALDVLDAFVQARLRGVYDAIGVGELWPAEWLPELRAAFEIQMGHPQRTDVQLTTYLDFLGTIEANGEQLDVARRLLVREPLSATLHNYLRYCVLRDEGAESLLAEYDALVAASTEADLPSQEWFAGLGAFMAAEQHVRNERIGAAFAAYARSVAWFESSLAREGTFAPTANHYIALSFASRARLHLEADALAESVDALIEGVGASPASADSIDGLGHSPARIAYDLRRKLRRDGPTELLDLLIEEMTLQGVTGFERAPPPPPQSRPPERSAPSRPSPGGTGSGQR